MHLHHGEEEWAYVLSGEGEVQLDDHTKAILPGTYILFPAAREAHAIRNTGTEDLVCLMGGTAPAADVIDLPEHGHRVAKTRNGFEAAPLDSFTLKNPVTTPEG